MNETTNSEDVMVTWVLHRCVAQEQRRPEDVCQMVYGVTPQLI